MVVLGWCIFSLFVFEVLWLDFNSASDTIVDLHSKFFEAEMKENSFSDWNVRLVIKKTT